MTRTNPSLLTKEAARQYEIYRATKKQDLAAQLLERLNPGADQGQYMFTAKDVLDHEDYVLSLLGQVRTYYTSAERMRLYKSNKNIAISLVQLILSSTGHPVKLRHCTQYTVACSLV